MTYWNLLKKIKKSKYKKAAKIIPLIKIHPSTFSRKINGLLQFNKNEKETLAALLNCDEEHLFKKSS